MEAINLLLWLCISCCCLVICSCGSDVKVIYGYEDPSKNMVKNWDFEDNFNPDGSDWKAIGATVTFSSAAHTGTRSARITQLTSSRFTGVTQKFSGIKAHTPYYLSVFLNFLKNPTSSMFFNIRLTVSYRNSVNDLKRFSLARFPAIRKGNGWRQLGGDFMTEDSTDELTFEMEISDLDMEYLIDTASLVELDDWKSFWESRANAEISRNRQNLITMNMIVPNSANIPYCKIKLKLKHNKLHFGIGSAIRADPFNAQTDFGAKYREFFTDTFEWAVFENDMKWKPMEGREGSPKYGRVDASFATLEAHNISVRGHSVLWSLKESNPTWVQSKTGDNLWNKVNARISSVVAHYKGKVIHWDALNEYLHGKFYSAGVNDYQFIDKIHRKIRAVDADVALYLNDYQALRSGDYTSALADLALQMKSRNVPVDGVGVQSHLRTVPLSVAQMKKRLEICTNTGLPVTLTELSIHDTDVKIRAWQLNAVFKTAFANPGVDGIIFWGFSDVRSIGFLPEETALFTGTSFSPNDAGSVLLKLIKKWRTNRVIKVQKRVVKETIKAYHGDYTLSVYYKSNYIKNVTFYLHPGQDITVNVPLSWGEVRAVYDDDSQKCDVSRTMAEDNEDDDDATNPRNSGFGYATSAWKKKTTRATRRATVRARNVASS